MGVCKEFFKVFQNFQGRLQKNLGRIFAIRLKDLKVQNDIGLLLYIMHAGVHVFTGSRMGQKQRKEFPPTKGQ